MPERQQQQPQQPPEQQEDSPLQQTDPAAVVSASKETENDTTKTEMLQKSPSRTGHHHPGTNNTAEADDNVTSSSSSSINGDDALSLKSSQQQHQQQQQHQSSSTTIITNLGPNDVLLGRGTGANANLGNVNYRNIVQTRILEEITSKSWNSDNPSTKRQLAREIVATVKAEGGRFLRRMSREEYQEQMNDSTTSTSRSQYSSSLPDFFFQEVPDTVAIFKTKESFRHQLRSVMVASQGNEMGLPTALVAKPSLLVRSPEDGNHYFEKQASMDDRRRITTSRHLQQHGISLLAESMFANSGNPALAVPPTGFPRLALDAMRNPALMVAAAATVPGLTAMESLTTTRMIPFASSTTSSSNSSTSTLLDSGDLRAQLERILQEEEYNARRLLMLDRAFLLSRSLSSDQGTPGMRALLDRAIRSSTTAAAAAAAGLENNARARLHARGGEQQQHQQYPPHILTEWLRGLQNIHGLASKAPPRNSGRNNHWGPPPF